MSCVPRATPGASLPAGPMVSTSWPVRTRFLRRRRGAVLALGIAALGLAAGVLADSTRDRALGATEHRTELRQSSWGEYFVVPHEAEEEVQIAFTIVNDEGHAVDYRYVTRAVDARGATIATLSGVVAVADQSSATQTVMLRVPSDVSWWSAVDIDLVGCRGHLRLPRAWLQAEGM